MSGESRITCIVCPQSCSLELDVLDGQVTEVRGNACKRGKDYALQEYTHPVRTLTSTVRVAGGVLPRLPVRSKVEIPRGKLMECLLLLDQVEVQAPVRMGQVVLSDAGDTGVDIVAGRHMPRKSS